MFRLMKLKPPHGWDAVGWELAIVTLVYCLRSARNKWWKVGNGTRKLRRRQEILDAELHRNAVSAYKWLTVAPCVDQQLNSIDKALSSARQSGNVPATPQFTPPLEVFTEDAWLDARAMQVADHLSPQINCFLFHAFLSFSGPRWAHA